MHRKYASKSPSRKELKNELMNFYTYYTVSVTLSLKINPTLQNLQLNKKYVISVIQ